MTTQSTTPNATIEYLSPEEVLAAFGGAEAFAAQCAPVQANAPAYRTNAGSCWECGRRGRRLYPAQDLSGVEGMVCRACKANEDFLSFA